MDFTISLAHFCEVHGPTSIICTQASTASCGTCNPCVTPPSEEAPQSAFSYTGLYDQPTLKLNSRLPQLSSPFETPPTSPRSPSYNPYFPSYSGSDSGLTSRRPSSVFDPESETCENCQFIVSKTRSEKLPAGAPGSPSKDGRGKYSPPVLRTSQKIPVRGSGLPDSDEYSSSPDSSDVSDSEHSRSYGSTASYPDSIPSSPTFHSRGTHTHTLNYMSTNQPPAPTSFSLLRRTIIRTLSTEVLPSGKSSGPLFFGDEVAGYTIAYVFRLRDPRARGHHRTYSLIALTGRDSRRASKTMVKVLGVFESIANRMVALAQKVAERESAASTLNLTQSRPATAIPGTPPLSTSASSMPTFTSPRKERVSSSVASSPTSRNITPVSSFLSAKRVDPDGYPRVSTDMRAKNLTEIVGMDDLFVQLHAQFVNLIHSIIAEFGI